MEKPVDLRTTDPVSTDGLEDLLEVEAIDIKSDSPDLSYEGLDPGQDYWTVEEASRNLSVSQRTVFRRLKKGTLSGFKVDGPFGEEWRIEPVDPGPEESRPGSDRVHDPKKEAKSTHSYIESEIEFLRDLVKNQSSQLEAASNVIVYMKNQLESKDEQIKLLTDSQHQSSAWRRFTKWFFGR